MQELIASLLLLARVSSVPVAPRQVDLDELVRGLARDLDPGATPAAGRITVSHLPAVRGDPGQLRQLFQNLLVNALKFRRPGRPAAVKVSGRIRADGAASIRVADDGVGFDMENARRLFQPFSRLHSRRDFPGTGMGLAICQRIVQRHGGAIAAVSEPGRGTTFTVIFPPPPKRGGGRAARAAPAGSASREEEAL
jgi:signal transduction histidine kinase